MLERRQIDIRGIARMRERGDLIRDSRELESRRPHGSRRREHTDVGFARAENMAGGYFSDAAVPPFV